MAYNLAPFHSIPLDEALLELLISEHESITLPRLRRLWSYYRNALAEPNSRGGSLGAPAQAAGLPPRLHPTAPLEAHGEQQKHAEVVIENDIAWRIHTLVDFMFPQAPTIRSSASDPKRAAQIEDIVNAVLEANGAIAMWQDAALLGSVYGQVDFLLDCQQLDRIGASKRRGVVSSQRQGISGADVNPSPASATSSPDTIASLINVEIIEAPRAIALLNPNDYRQLDAYILHFQKLVNEADRSGLLARLSRAMRSRSSARSRRGSVTVTEIISATHCQRYEDGTLVSETLNRLGRLPVVHVQNLSQPLMYSGLSDVEPLIPLQDELNTRLSDRANRVTMQSFRMWLGKGIEGFADQPVGPGQMWVTDNMDATIEAFGGDASSPSEKAHIEELREAMDKTSGVTPAAAGHIRARVGNLTSENALRISLMGTLAKTKRKRVTYGAGVAQLCELILHALDVYGVFRTRPEERRFELSWTDPIASDESRRIADALAKAQLGVPASVLRAELNGVAAELDPHGNVTTRRTMRGIRSSLTTNILVPGEDGVPSGDGVDGKVLTEEVLNGALRIIWEQSSGHVDTILCGGHQKRQINQFVAASQRFVDHEKTYSSMVDVYESDYGVCRVIMSRWAPPNSLLLLDSSRLAVLPLSGRSFQFKPLASSGDAEFGQVIGEYTLEMRNENAHGVLDGLSITG